jgi:hypothetical protein
MDMQNYLNVLVFLLLVTFVEQGQMSNRKKKKKKTKNKKQRTTEGVTP